MAVHGPAARPARQRRPPAARRGQPRDVRGSLAGLRRGRGADQRRSRTACTPPPGWRARSSSWSARRSAATSPRRRRAGRHAEVPAPSSGRPRALRRAWSRTSARGCAQSWEQRGASDAELGWIDDGARPRRAHDRLRAPRPVVQAADADAPRPRAAQGAAAATPTARADRDRRQVAPGRRRRQEAHPAARAASPTTRRCATASSSCPTTTSAWRAALPRLRRLAQQPAAPARGLRHVAA